MTIRAYVPADLAALHAINCASEPGVGKVSQSQLDQIIAAGACLVAEDRDTVLGFLVALGPDADYDSPNYRWFEARYESYVYVDRIAVAPETREQGIGAALYEAAFMQYTGKALIIGCEVNITPPNPGSMRFHQRLGFTELGQTTHRADYAVAYFARRLGL